MTPKEIAYELMRGNPDASTWEIRVWTEVEAGTEDLEILNKVTSEYQMLRNDPRRSRRLGVLE